LKSTKGAYFPSIDLYGQLTSTDDKVFPTGVTRSAIGLSVSLPIWNNAQREIRVSRATTVLDVTRAIRLDTERGLRRDVVEAYQAYETARAAGGLAQQAVTVATENLRVQQERYRAGASVILDLLTAQVGLTETEAGLVQARYTTRLALSALEAILGRRLF
jgi:outer membrane protein TolC